MCVGVFAKYGSGAFKDEATDVLDAIPKLPDKFGLQVKQSYSPHKSLFIVEYLFKFSGISQTHKVGNIPIHLQFPSLFAPSGLSKCEISCQ